MDFEKRVVSVFFLLQIPKLIFSRLVTSIVDMENPGEYHSVDDMDVSDQQSNTNADRRPLVKMRGLYPIGGPKIIREEFEKLGFEYRPPNTPNGKHVIKKNYLLFKFLLRI